MNEFTFSTVMARLAATSRALLLAKGGLIRPFSGEVASRNQTGYTLHPVGLEKIEVPSADPASSAQQAANESPIAQPVTFELEQLLDASGLAPLEGDTRCSVAWKEEAATSNSLTRDTIREVELAVGAIHASATNAMNLYFYKTLSAK